MKVLRQILAVVALCLIAAGIALGQGRDLPEAKPEAAGFSPERLQKLEKAMQGPVDSKRNCLASGAKRGRKHLQGSKSSKNLEA